MISKIDPTALYFNLSQASELINKIKFIIYKNSAYLVYLKPV